MAKSPIKFAGINLSWQSGYARKYRDMLDEMGYFSKLIIDPTSVDEYGTSEVSYLVAYCYRHFSREEIDEALAQVFEFSPPIE